MERPIKIAISGSHGTGKTTTVNELAKIFRNNAVEIVPEFARNFIETNDNPNVMMEGAAHPISQMMALIHYPVLEQQAQLKNPALIISDRGILDSYSYIRAVNVPLDEFELKYMIDMTTRHAQSYHHVFYHPIEFPLKQDGVRDIDIRFQEHMDKAIRHAWKAANVPIIEVGGSVIVRTHAIFSTLHRKYGL